MFTNVNKADVHNLVGFYDFSRSFNRDFIRNNKDKIRKCLNGNNYASIWWTALSIIICTTTHHCLNIDQVSALFDENKNQVMSRNLYRVITFLKFGVLQPQKDIRILLSTSFELDLTKTVGAVSQKWSYLRIFTEKYLC